MYGSSRQHQKYIQNCQMKKFYNKMSLLGYNLWAARKFSNSIRTCCCKSTSKDSTIIYPLQDVHSFITRCLEAVGVEKKNAKVVADNMVEADCCGQSEHGLERLESLIKEIQLCLICPNAAPKIKQKDDSIALVNGNNGLGPVVAQFCMDLALQKTYDFGVGVVSCYQSNDFGLPSMYSMQAVSKGYIGISLTNDSPKMVPTGAKAPALGANPISVAAPGDNDCYILDMTTTVASMGRIKAKLREKKKLPDWWAMNCDGGMETDPQQVLLVPHLFPLGGLEVNSGYKGFGLGMMVDILSGVLSGAKVATKIPHYGPPFKGKAKANLGHFFMALNPDCFAPDFRCRMSDLMNTIRCLEPNNRNKPVLIPGDPEREHRKKVSEAGGVKYHKDVLESVAFIAKDLEVPPMEPNKCK